MAQLNDSQGEKKHCVWLTIVVCAAMLVFAFHACTHMVAAGDTWVAMACGRHFVNHGVDTVEPFSANSHEAGPTEEEIQAWPGWARSIAKPFSQETIKKWHPTGWINQNWLTHVIFYWLVDTFDPSFDGFDGNFNPLVWWKFVVNILAIVCIYYLARLLGVHPLLAVAAASFALFVGRSFIDIRPAVYSNLLVPAFLLVLALTTYKNNKYIWLLVPLVVFWCNVHGGYIYIFIMLVPFIGIHLLASLPSKWTLTAFSILTWTTLYALTRKFLTHEIYATLYQLTNRLTYTPKSLTEDGFLQFLVIAAAASVIITALSENRKEFIYTYHIIASIIFIIACFQKFFIITPLNLTKEYREFISWHIQASQFRFILLTIIMVASGVLLSFRKHRLISIGFKDTAHVISAAFAAFIAMIIFNPFHLTNLTHTFEISVSEHAASWRSVNEWRPAFDSMDKMRKDPNPVGDEEAFAVMCIIALVIFLIWLVVRFLKPKPLTGKRAKQKETPSADSFQWPKIDLALFAIAALTIYMAIRSRRFIPIAASASCALLALLLHQTIQMLAAKINFSKTKQLRLPAMPAILMPTLLAGASAVVIICGTFWTLKFKKIYLDPWPADAKRDSVFMRMTASNIKPFDACKFIRENELSGKVFNYWTEGGAVAFGQIPDPQAGKTPLQLFMDGRAQAAYNHDKFQLWQKIKFGGPTFENAVKKHGSIESAQKNLTNEQKIKIGKWIDKQLKNYQVWVVLMPTTEMNSAFVQGLQGTPNWLTAYMDDDQHLFVDTDAPQGKELRQKILDETAAFPNDYSKYVTTAQNLLRSQNPKDLVKAYDYATKAFKMNPSQTSMLVLARVAPINTAAYDVIKVFLDDFTKNMDQSSKKSGYAIKLTAAVRIANILSRRYKKADPKLAELYLQFYNKYKNEPKALSLKSKW
jgi:hypothetical protein